MNWKEQHTLRLSWQMSSNIVKGFSLRGCNNKNKNCIIDIILSLLIRVGLNGHLFINFELRYLGHFQFMTNRLRITNLQKKIADRLATCKNKYAASALRPKKMKFVEGGKVWNKKCLKWFKFLFQFFLFWCNLKKVMAQKTWFWPIFGNVQIMSKNACFLSYLDFWIS